MFPKINIIGAKIRIFRYVPLYDKRNGTKEKTAGKNVYLRRISKKRTVMIRGVIFDMDGVLVFNRDAHIEAFEVICRKYGVPFSRKEFMPTFGMTNDQILAKLMPEVIKKMDWHKIAAEKEEIYREIFERTIAPAPGLVDFLKALKNDGFKTAVGSSGNTPNVNFVLSRCGITPYFDAIANGDMITHGKPDPEVYLLAAKKLNLDPAECIVAEDAPVGIEAARRAGCAVMAIASTFERSALSDYDLLIDDFTQISTNDLRNLKN